MCLRHTPQTCATTPCMPAHPPHMTTCDTGCGTASFAPFGLALLPLNRGTAAAAEAALKGGTPDDDDDEVEDEEEEEEEEEE